MQETNPRPRGKLGYPLDQQHGSPNYEDSYEPSTIFTNIIGCWFLKFKNRVKQSAKKSRTFLVSVYFFSQQQCLRRLGCCTPRNKPSSKSLLKVSILTKLCKSLLINSINLLKKRSTYFLNRWLFKTSHFLTKLISSSLDESSRTESPAWKVNAVEKLWKDSENDWSRRRNQTLIGEHVSEWVRMCVCVCEWERECLRVRECERECVTVREREGKVKEG